MAIRAWLGAVVAVLVCVCSSAAEPSAARVSAQEEPSAARVSAQEEPSAARVSAQERAQLVFGSFSSQANAERWVGEVGRRISLAAHVKPNGAMYRVVSDPLDDAALASATESAKAAGLEAWQSPAAPSGGSSRRAERSPWDHEMDLDVGFQTRSYAHTGYDGQSQFQPSVSVSYRYRATLPNSDTITFTPFARVDAEDEDRTHADLRELYWSHVGDDWDLHVGVKQVFWGVTEFKHLVDVINQTDFVENIDGEDRLGQPMVNLSVVSDWGIVDFFVLPGFRERTFPGKDGRLRFAYEVDRDAEYERGAGKGQVDYAVRWSHQIGPVEWGIYQFEGVGRDPLLVPELRPDGDVVLRPHYDAVDQTGLDAQAILGDWALKLEAISRRAFGERFNAANAGFERTFVGAIGRADLGIVVEYMYDERGDDAFDTILERDLALGTRFRLNDVSDTQALLGFIWDTETEETLVQLEASRRLGDAWALILESRVFGGADDDPFTPANEYKTAPFQRDDYVQLELTRFF